MGYVLHQGATVMCMHGAQAQPSMTSTRVKVAGQAAVTQSGTYTISGCQFMLGQVKSPCVTGQWVSAATRVKSDGQPLLLRDSQAVCAPNGTGFNVSSTQTRVKAQ